MTTITQATEADVGCWFDGARGVYIGEAIRDEARAFGWKAKFDGINEDSEDFPIWESEATDEAVDWLNDNLRHHDDYSFGFSESGDFGYWHHCEDDERTTHCEFC